VTSALIWTDMPFGRQTAPMTPETRYARTVDGTHVAYQVHGDGPIDILVLRAWYSNLDHEWGEPILAGVYRRLGALGRVVRLDRRGTGLSDRLDHDALPTLEHRLDDMRAVLDAVGSERVVLLGLAHGAALCSVFAATYPERTSGLVLWSPTWTLVGRSEEAATRAYADRIEKHWGTDAMAREIVAGAAPSRTDDEDFVRWIREDARASGSAADARALWELVATTNIDAILPTVHVPTAVLWRTGSAIAAPYFADRIPEAQAIELPGDDHALISRDWHPALAAIEQVIEGLDDRLPESDRVLATVLFSDVVGSTKRAAAIGDAAWRTLVDRHHASVRRELARHRGREIDTAGDGFFAAFDGPARAIRCAFAIRDTLADLDLDVRIGLHAGECERVGSGLRGVAVHVGARVGGIAKGGEILVTSTVRDLVAGSGIEFEDAGRHELKGIPESWQLFRVTTA
jgi:class 3 adenylate cyclase